MAWLLSLPIAVLLLIFAVFPKLQSNEKVNMIQPSASATPQATVKEPLKVKVSIPYWDQQKGVKSFKENVDLINYVSLFWYFLGDDGQIHKYNYAKEDLSIISFAHENGVKVEVVITNLPENGDWDSDRVGKVLTNNDLKQKHIDEIVELSERLDIDGIDIDYEQVDKNLKDDLSEFIKRLGEALHSKGKYLGVALHPKSDDGIGNTNGALAQDWPKIAQGADNLYIMAFNEHWDESGPGPVSSIGWVERIVKYAQSLGIERHKLFLTIPLFGYDWKKDSNLDAKGLTHSEVTKLLEKYSVSEQWDETNASAYFHYGDGEVWFENARSVEGKIKLAESAGFKGITFWRLGGEDPQIWKELQIRE